ncbi:UNVERIFIED_CONTAM: glycosyltransferase family 2 protein [Spiribacter pallidus]
MIDVVIPTCDRPQRLAQALASVGGQRSLPARLIVVDNGRVAAQPAGPDGVDLICVKAPVHCGAAQARNIGAARADSPWVAFLDDDDRWHPDYLGAWRRASAADPGPRLWLGRVEILDEDGERVMTKQWDAAAPRAVLRHNPGVVGSNIIIDRAAFCQVGGFDVALHCGEDRALLWRCLRAQVPVAALPQACVWLQGHGQGRLSDTRSLLRGKAHFAWRYRHAMRLGDWPATLGSMAVTLWGALRKRFLP